MTRLEEAQGLTHPPQTEEEKEYPEPAPASTKGEDIDHTEPADLVKDAAVPPKEISDSNPPAIPDDVHPEKGVGHVMLEGSPEKRSEIRELEKEAIKSPETQLIADLQPAALDGEVAAMIAEEEVKDDIPASPDAMRSISPLPFEKTTETETEQIETPPLDDVLDLGEDDGSKKRAREVDLGPAPKRPRRRNFPALPESLSHLIHPPTTCIYISNLRRPLLLPALHEYLFPDEDPSSSSKPSTLLPSTRAPFSSEDTPNIWLSGVKSHAYAVFDNVDEAIETVKRIEGKQFPEETGGELKVEFVDEDEITGLVEKEQAAWSNGRKKLELKITKEDDGGYRFELEGAGNVDARSSQSGMGMRGVGPSMRGGRMNGGGMGGMGSRPIPTPMAGRPLTGVNAVPAGVNGRGGPSSYQSASNGSFGGRGGNGGGGGRYPPRGGFGGGGSNPSIGQRGVPPHLDRRSEPGFRDRMAPGPSGDTYRPRDGARDRNGGGGVDSYRPRDGPEVRDGGPSAGGGGGGGVDSYRPSDRDGGRDRNGLDSYVPGNRDDRADDDRRTSARPNLSWKERSGR